MDTTICIEAKDLVKTYSTGIIFKKYTPAVKGAHNTGMILRLSE
ncbi:MAG: hypothetical protein ABII23_02470 [bacterium]